MTGILEAVTLITSLTQLAARAMESAAELTKVIEKARAEGRDLTPAELDAMRQSVMDARARLTS